MPRVMLHKPLDRSPGWVQKDDSPRHRIFDQATEEFWVSDSPYHESMVRPLPQSIEAAQLDWETP